MLLPVCCKERRTLAQDGRHLGHRSFQGALRLPQDEAVGQILEHDDGILCAPTAFGKTAVAA
jgi:superfamily II DNA or RNA helicase